MKVSFNSNKFTVITQIKSLEKVMDKKKYVVFLGYSFFPYGLAEVQKMILISKCLLSTNNHVTVICKNGFHDKNRYPDLKVKGFYEDIEYIYASGSAFRNDRFF